jgi:phenylpropionate dioxygenase-like ring-hydroxylating dioxygenase large terminal subunit
MNDLSEGPPPAAPGRDEVSRALRRCWQPVARLDELCEGPQRRVMLGEALAVFLTESGDPAVLADRCPHRGASLSGGTVRGEALQCPYHGWQWQGRGGACVRIPSLPDQGRIPDRARVASYPAREQWGLIWSALEEPLEELPQAPWLAKGAWELGHGSSFELPVSLGVMLENYRDVAHFAFVHKDTFEMPEVIEPLAVSRDGIVVEMQRGMRGGANSDPIWDGLREIRYRTVAPNFASGHLTADKGERCLLHAARAISATDSAHYWLAGVTADYEYSLEETIASEEELYAEDRPVVSTVEPRELSLDTEAELSTLADSFTLAYRRAFAEFTKAALAR